ncbi:MAG TPA: FAD-dependent oxidoreductase, partial [Aggregatilineales bacterium]|nr:FAD-dependent oxidoreductase [Aggregatilineales bacterium]
MPPNSSEHRVVVVGAGLAGLTAALHVAERGLSVLVLDADPERAGGRLRGGPPVTLEAKNSPLESPAQRWSFPGEHGIHGVWQQYHNLRALLSREGIDPGFVRSRREAW